jgi:large subunit ribosomal protein L7/L12
VSKLTQEEIIEALSNLTVLELAELKSALEEKWGVQAAAAAPAMVMAAPGEGAGGEAAEESTEFQVTLTEAPADKKIAVIKVVREVTGLGLKEAKEAVEGVPTVLKESTGKEDAEEIVKKIEAAGAKAAMKGL